MERESEIKEKIQMTTQTLQAELENKIIEVTSLQQQIETFTMRIESLESALIEKQSRISEQHSRIIELKRQQNIEGMERLNNELLIHHKRIETLETTIEQLQVNVI